MRQTVLYIIILILSLLLFNQCLENNNIKIRESKNYSFSTDSVRYFKNRLSGITASVNTLELTKTDLENTIINKDKEITDLMSEFSRVKTLTHLNAEVQIPVIAIKFDSINIDNYLEKERKGFLSSQWYSLQYKVTNDSLVLNNVSIETEATIITGTKRKWIFGKSTVTTDVTFSNPYIAVGSITAAEVAVREPIYKKWYLWLAVGLAGGVAISN